MREPIVTKFVMRSACLRSLAPPLHRTAAAARKPSRLQRGGGTARCQALSEDARDVTAGGRAASGRPPRSVKELTEVQTVRGLCLTGTAAGGLHPVV